MSPEEIEELLTQTSKNFEVSVPKLRALYIRGVKEAVANGLDGPPHNYGLVRVHRFVSAMSTSNPRLTQDHDLLPRHTKTPATPNINIEYSDEDFKTFQLVSAVLSGDIIHAIPEAEDIHFDAEKKELVLSTPFWEVRIDLKTAEYKSESKKQ